MACLWFSITALNYPVSACQALSPGLSYRKKETQMPDWAQKQTGMSILILLPEEPDTAYHEPLEGPQGKKDSFSAPPAAGAHPRLLSQFLCVSVLCKFLTFITVNSSPCSFLNFCLKKVLHSDFDREQRQAYMFNLPPLLQ